MTDILRELQDKIEVLARSIADLRDQLNIQTQEMSQLSSQVTRLESDYNLKKMELMTLTRKLEDKTKVLQQARMSFDKVNLS
ncbi:MAG: hypothetical protein MJ252_18425 [archaeon]|nr:hypothetical protein [archaeon]